jgi:hypothetical protein
MKTPTPKTNKAEHLLVTGAIVEVEPKKKKKFTLEELQGFVGGYIEFVYLPGGKIMVVNEEGRLQGLPVNQGASAIAERLIVGDVLIARKGLV